MARILVTGATGFVGTALIAELAGQGYQGVRAMRRDAGQPPNGWKDVIVGDVNGNTSWLAALDEMDTVIHLAARVHITRESLADPLPAFREVNAAGTRRLAEHAAATGVKRFIYLSSVKVNGETTDGRSPFMEYEEPQPGSPYGLSKFEAERALWDISYKTGMEVVIIRPPLVYGPGVKANFLTMMRWVHRGLPLPLGLIDNRRSMVALDNLVDLIIVCIGHPRAGNQVFFVSDDDDVSTTSLLTRLAAALGRPARLVPVPPAIIKILAFIGGRSGQAQRLCGSLQVSVEKAKNRLDWKPPRTMASVLKDTARHYLTLVSQ